MTNPIAPLRHRLRVGIIATMALALVVSLSACSGWRSANSLPLPGTQGKTAGSYTVKIQMPDVNAIDENSQVKVNDVNVGTVSKIDREDWHALVTVRINGDVNLPANATAKVGQTSLLGTLHIELADPVNERPVGRLKGGDTIPLSRAGDYPSTEQTLSSVSVVLNGGGLAQLQQINQQLNSALSGHEGEARGLIRQLETFTDALNDQKSQIIAASEGLDKFAGRLNARAGVIDRALADIPPALDVLARDRDNLRKALLSIGDFSTMANRVVSQSKDDVSANLANLGPTLQQLANAGPNLVQSLGLLLTFPWPQKGINKFIKGDAGNLSATIDLTLGRIDNSYLQETPLDGKLTELETLLGRTANRQPTPSTRNPLMNPILRGTS